MTYLLSCYVLNLGHIGVSMHAHTGTHTCMHTHMCTYAHKHMHAHTHTCIHIKVFSQETTQWLKVQVVEKSHSSHVTLSGLKTWLLTV